jgi:hypothetical protein
MSRTLNDLIATAVLGGEEVEEAAPASAEVRTQPLAEATDVPNDVEKIAAALEFMGRRGVGVLLEKQAAGGKAGDGNVGTNCGQMHSEKVQKQVGPHAGAPPMKAPGYGQIPNNAGKKPGGGKEVDTAAQGHGTHHPALASNEAAIAYTKKEKAKKVVPALGQVLDTPAFKDGKLKENLSNTAGDKNIKKAHALTQIQAELERRGAGRTV